MLLYVIVIAMPQSGLLKNSLIKNIFVPDPDKTSCRQIILISNIHNIICIMLCLCAMLDVTVLEAIFNSKLLRVV